MSDEGSASRLSEAWSHTEGVRNRDGELGADAPYTNYTPLPGVIPPTEPPYFPHTWGCIPQNKCFVKASQPIIPIPVQQEILKKERIIEVEQTVITDKIQPKVWKQEIYHECPKLAVDIRERKLNIPQLKIEEAPQEITIPVGFSFSIEPTWEERSVPRLFPKYSGRPNTIKIPIPQIQIVNKKIENEVPIYVGEKHVEKEVVEEEGVECVNYKYVKEEREVPVYKYRPVFDVEVSIPPPVIVPIPVAPHETALEAEQISYQEYKRQKAAKRLCVSRCCEDGSPGLVDEE